MNFRFQDTFGTCYSYKGYEYNCTSVFRRILTNNGFCFSFNLLDYDTIFKADAIGSNFDSYKGKVFANEIFKGKLYLLLINYC